MRIVHFIPERSASYTRKEKIKAGKADSSGLQHVQIDAAKRGFSPTQQNDKATGGIINSSEYRSGHAIPLKGARPQVSLSTATSSELLSSSREESALFDMMRLAGLLIEHGAAEMCGIGGSVH